MHFTPFSCRAYRFRAFLFQCLSFRICQNFDVVFTVNANVYVIRIRFLMKSNDFPFEKFGFFSIKTIPPSFVYKIKWGIQSL